MPPAIPGFDPERAAFYLDGFELTGVRHKQAIRDLVRLCSARHLDGRQPGDAALAAAQQGAWHHLAPIMARQLGDGAWQPLPYDRTGWFDTTPWVLVFLGYLGVDGTAKAGVARGAQAFLRRLVSTEHPTYACRYAMFLRALLQLGFGGPSSPDDVQAALHAACGAHVRWMLERGAHCRATTRRDTEHCACALVKELLLLASLPRAWRGARYAQAVALGQERLIAAVEGPAGCPAKGRQWGEHGYFRHVCPSWFEWVEALVGTGCVTRDVLAPALAAIGARCEDAATWRCDYRARRSVLRDGVRRTLSWPINLEPTGHPSPWLTLRALWITRALEARG